MKKENQTKEAQQKRFLLVLPVLVLPFITVLFYLLGGGSGNQAQAQVTGQKGLKTDLPEVKIKEESGGKMSYYDRANADSLRKSDLEKNDPYYRNSSQLTTGNPVSDFNNPYSNGSNNLNGGYGYKDPNEARVYEKLESLNQSMRKNNAATSQLHSPYDEPSASAANNADIKKLEKMMQMMQSGEANSEDSEMQEINGMLEKILDIQHPNRVNDKLKSTSKKSKGQVFQVLSEKPLNQISLLQSTKAISTDKENAGFFGLNDSLDETEFPTNTIRAVVQGTQSILSGSELKMKLINDVYINGVRIPKGNVITGIASLNGERLNVSIDQIQYANYLFPVQLAVYDLTGLEGIRIEGALSRDVAKQSGSSAIQNMDLAILDPSIAAQAATAGIEFTKSLIGKKTKLIRVTVKSGHQVLLMDENQKNNE